MPAQRSSKPPQQLRALGLTEYEARAFTFLLVHGRSTARDVSKNADVPYGRVYDVLDALKHKKLVGLAEGKVALWQVINVRILSSLARKKAREMSGLAEYMERTSRTQ